MISIQRHPSTHQDFVALVALLDQYLSVVDGEDHAFYSKFNTLDLLAHCVVVYVDNVAVACGALKLCGASCFEIKRMFVHPTARGNGYAQRVVRELELWTRELGGTKTILETGKRMPDAIALYKKTGYTITENYGPYRGISDSVCFHKLLS